MEIMLGLAFIDSNARELADDLFFRYGYGSKNGAKITLPYRWYRLSEIRPISLDGTSACRLQLPPTILDGICDLSHCCPADRICYQLGDGDHLLADCGFVGNRPSNQSALSRHSRYAGVLVRFHATCRDPR